MIIKAIREGLAEPVGLLEDYLADLQRRRGPHRTACGLTGHSGNSTGTAFLTPATVQHGVAQMTPNPEAKAILTAALPSKVSGKVCCVSCMTAM